MTETARATRVLMVTAVVGLLVFAWGLTASAGNYNEECEAYRNHSGNIPGYYDYAVFFEQGYEPVEVWTNGEPIYLPPPDGGTWDRVYKCKSDDGTTTTGETTTTEPGSDSTTTTDSSSTTLGSTTTTESPTTTSESDMSTTTTDPTTTTTDPGDPELPFTGGGLTLLLPAGLLVAGGAGALLRARREQ